MTIREALLAMGYQEQKPGKWMKPVGFHGLAYDEKVSEWSNWFRAQGSMSLTCWERAVLKDGEPLPQLKAWEAYTNLSTGVGSHFEFAGFDL